MYYKRLCSNKIKGRQRERDRTIDIKCDHNRSATYSSAIFRCVHG